MADTENDSLEEWFENYRTKCNAALRTTVAKIDSLREMVENNVSRSPIDSVRHRTKTWESIVEKCNRKGYELTPESIEKNVEDIVAIRIVTPFRDDIDAVVNILHSAPDITIRDEKDYVRNPKPNGYSSYHMHLVVGVYDPILSENKTIPIEIQIRDKAMDLWASIEHIIKYKNADPSPEVSEKFKNIADILTKFDDMAIELREYSSQEKALDDLASAVVGY